MPRTLIKSRLHSNKHRAKINQEVKNTNSNLAPNFQILKQKLLSGSGFVENKETLV